MHSQPGYAIIMMGLEVLAMLQNCGKFVFLIILVGTYGCMANVTRSLPSTSLQPQLNPIPQKLKIARTAVVIFESQGTKIEGGHHEGLLQVRQPWLFGLSKEQRDVLYNNAGEVAALAFALELKRQGMSIVPYKEWSDEFVKQSDLLLTGRVDKVVINTYGRGTIEGVGSAGNYWEATVYISDIQLKDIKAEKVLWKGDLKSYAKLDNSPAKLDWDVLVLGKKLLNGALQFQKIQTSTSPLDMASAGESYVRNWEATYSMERPDITPVEVAARHAALQFLIEVKRGL